MTQQIKLTYVDDKVDTLLDEYLFSLKENGVISIFEDIEFDSSGGDYKSLLTDDRISKSDIIVIDSKLFENETAEFGSKFTGQEFSLIQRILNPYIKVIVITQNTDLSKYGVLNKFPTSREKSSQEDANIFYDKNLKPTIEEAIKEIGELRRIGEVLELNKGAYGGAMIVEQAQNLLNKIPTDYKELTNEKIDELIEIIQKDVLEG